MKKFKICTHLKDTEKKALLINASKEVLNRYSIYTSKYPATEAKSLPQATTNKHSYEQGSAA